MAPFRAITAALAEGRHIIQSPDAEAQSDGLQAPQFGPCDFPLLDTFSPHPTATFDLCYGFETSGGCLSLASRH